MGGTLAFCLGLSDNPCNLVFKLSALTAMCADAVMKVHELGRQRVALSPRDVAPVFVYTYELQEEGDQIYAAMNAAMRRYDKALVAFWRPLLWQLHKALQRLPPYHGKLFRGINVRFSPEVYGAGQRVVWPSFSSASARRSVAEEFVKGQEGTLFFLHSRSARPISRFSHFPDEAEVLFLPQTVFEITSTLYGSSDIGRFYAPIDNVAMREAVGRAAGPPPPVAGSSGAPVPPPPAPYPPRLDARPDSSGITLYVPRSCFVPSMDIVAREFDVESTDVQQLSGGNAYAELVVAPLADDCASAADTVSHGTSASSRMITFEIDRDSARSPCPSVVSSVTVSEAPPPSLLSLASRASRGGGAPPQTSRPPDQPPHNPRGQGNPLAPDARTGHSPGRTARTALWRALGHGPAPAAPHTAPPGPASVCSLDDEALYSPFASPLGSP